MILLKLSSDNPKFKTLDFNEGLNILAGLQLSGADKETYNGIGKSFSLNLIHLMLGAKLDIRKRKEKKLLEFLSTYGVFTLTFIHDNKNYKIVKNFSEGHYHINDEKVLKTNYPKELRSIILGNNVDKNISFKQILNTFARRYGGSYYNDILSQQGRPNEDYYQRYVNLSLLGVDTSMVQTKFDIKTSLDKLLKAKNVVEDYESQLEEVNIKDLKDTLNKLVDDKNNFVIAENYDEFKKQADKKTNKLNIIRNNIHDIVKSISRKRSNLNQIKSINIDIKEVKNLYDEAKFFFDDQIIVRLKDASQFHRDLMGNRVLRLESDIVSLNAQLEELEDILKKEEKARDNILKDLDSKGALEEYNSISERIGSLTKEIQELDKYKVILEGFKKDKSKLDFKNAKINSESIEYLTNSKDKFDEIENKFRELVKRFYLNHGGEFKIIETKDAKYLFDIDVEIPRDGSQAINEVKIFCYDFLLYLLNPNILGFLAHDGCIFSEMDPRQKSMIFKVALDFVKKHNMQYFINIGESSLNEVLDKDNKLNMLNDIEKKDIEDSVILKLYDKDPSQWLFGTSFG